MFMEEEIQFNIQILIDLDLVTEIRGDSVGLGPFAILKFHIGGVGR